MRVEAPVVGEALVQRELDVGDVAALLRLVREDVAVVGADGAPVPHAQVRAVEVCSAAPEPQRIPEKVMVAAWWWWCADLTNGCRSYKLPLNFYKVKNGEMPISNPTMSAWMHQFQQVDGLTQ